MTMQDPTVEDVKARTLEALGQVWDPELGIDIVNLGLVYDVRVEDDTVTVDMTLTTPGCPVSESLPEEAEAAVRSAVADRDVAIQIVWEPAWTPERLSPAASETLGFRR